MQHVSELITQHQNASAEPTASSGSLTPQHIALLWERMAMIYGHRWVSSYGEKDDGTWLKGLHDISPEQVGIGLEKCRTSDDEWAPTLPVFRDRCLPPKKPDPVPYHKALPPVMYPVGPKNMSLADECLAKMRNALGRVSGKLSFRKPEPVKPYNDVDFENDERR